MRPSSGVPFSEVEDAVVLQEPSEDAHDSHVLAEKKQKKTENRNKQGGDKAHRKTRAMSATHPGLLHMDIALGTWGLVSLSLSRHPGIPVELPASPHPRPSTDSSPDPWHTWHMPQTIQPTSPQHKLLT